MGEKVTQKTVLNLLSSAMFQKPFNVDNEVDWKLVFDECRAQSVTSLAFSALPKNKVIEEVFNKWKEQVNSGLAANSRICYAHTMLHNLLTEAGITYVILKGCASAEYYPDPLLRTMGDVDFYIRENDKKTAHDLLIKNGFVFNDHHHEIESAYEKNGVILELHWGITGVPGGKTGALIQRYFEDVFEKSLIKQLDLAHYNSPSPFHHGLIMLLHVARHMITGGIGLRHFCDWAVFIDKVGDDFVPMFEDKLKQVGLWRFAQIITQFCTVYLGLPKQEWAGIAERQLLEQLKDDVFASGNFGHKDLSRADEAKFITSRKKGGVNNDSNIKQAVLSANEIVRRHWKFADKLPVIYPIGWAFFGSRYALRALVGKRNKININIIAKGAEKRKGIYRSLELFRLNN